MANSETANLIKEAQRAYKKQWRSRNKDKVKASNEKYWLKKAVEMGLTPEAKEAKKDD